MRLIIDLLKMPKQLWLYLLLASLLGIIGHLAVISIFLVGGFGIVKYFDTNTLNLGLIVLLMIGLALLRAISRYIEQALNHYVAFRLLASIRHDVFAKLRNLDLGYLEQQQKAKLLSVISNDVELLEVFFAHTITPIIIAVIVSALSLIFISYYYISLMLVLLITFIILGIIIPIIYYHLGKNNSDLNRELCSDLSNIWYQIINGWQSLINANQPDYLYQPMMDTTKRLAKSDKVNLVYTNILKGWTAIGISCCLVVFVLVSYHTNISASSLIIGLCLCVGCFGPINSLTLLGSGLTNTFASAKRILQILNTPANVIGGEASLNRVEKINIKNLHFGYDHNLVFNGFSTMFDHPGFYFITGVNGRGKSTLFKILMHYYKINPSEIIINNRDLSIISDFSLHRHIAMMDQYPFFFNASVKDNLLMVKPNASVEELHNCLAQAHILDVINQHQGLDTIVSPSTFSSGELQRLALARMVLYDAEVWLLDEPTTNLDSLTTGMILDTLKQYEQEKIIIIISHQPQVLMLDGEIINLEA